MVEKQQLPDTVAFDIDGALTEDEHLQMFRELMQTDGVEVGIVTARSQERADEFVEENNLKPNFTVGTQLKGQALSEISDGGLYYGSWFRDKVHAFIAGWEYKQL